MKPTTEDFLIPIADAIRLFVNTEDVDFVQSATRARIHAARLAKMAHDKECQRLADEWVEQNKAEYLQKTSDSRFSYGSRSNLKYSNNLDKIWLSMRDKADTIFRDYISETPPTA